MTPVCVCDTRLRCTLRVHATHCDGGVVGTVTVACHCSSSSSSTNWTGLPRPVPPFLHPFPPPPHTTHTTHTCMPVQQHCPTHSLSLLRCRCMVWCDDAVLYDAQAAMPVVSGRKSRLESFAGANVTYTIEAMMGDRKALQVCHCPYSFPPSLVPHPSLTPSQAPLLVSHHPTALLIQPSHTPTATATTNHALLC